MTKEFVPYDRALKLKELGFDETCFAWFVSREYGLQLGTVVKSDLFRDGILAPTFSQAFRWFREEYNRHSFIELIVEDKIRFDYVLYVHKDEADCIDYGDGPFETYEEAELACLDKLIEIVEGIESQK
jgi:hypothetical protein